ncbi:heterotrimeric G-protein alpha subunit, GPA1-like protein [Mycena metata]|uniref:Heterotrimeric G-protein alpha subunit, GPA1-like protein n=1 Tax=Mycena metata TaxID=1033252 RepID=A0AAD7K2K8_9AGAR|nr:heterotrimeric G-protein alpha subunit, GPA1-like protein [Mycena metata]
MSHLQGSGSTLQAKAVNNAIEEQLKVGSLKAKNEINILFLAAQGTDDSVLRRMKLSHQGGYNEREREEWKTMVFNAMSMSMRTVLEAMPELLELALAPENEAHRDVILSLPPQIEAEVLPRDIADAVRGLWRDPGVKAAVRWCREFQLAPDAAYYSNAIDRIAATNYLPTDDDILRCRTKETGVTETSFTVGELTYKIHHPSGQRSDMRKKWIHCFEDIKALLFCVTLNDYDQMVEEDDRNNRLQQSVAEFDSICNSRWFSKTSIILFLTDIDKFAEKLPRNPLANYFPDYEGGDNYDAACDYMLHRFVSLNQTAAKRQIHAHYVSSTDNQQIKFLLSAIQDILLQMHLRERGLR